MRRFKIKKIEIDGHYDTRRIYDVKQLGKTRFEFLNKHNIIIPAFNKLKSIGDRTALWILLEDLTITVVLENGSYLQFKFKAGFIWDQASVPFFKNNDKQEIIAAMVHDALFSLHLLYPNDNNKGFRATNSLFKQMTYYAIDQIVKEEGYSWFRRWMLRAKARRHYAAVMSVFGRARYETDSPRRAFWHEKTVQFDCSRINEFQ